MSTKHSGYPVDAAWEAVAKDGATAQYWLSMRTPREGSTTKVHEMWRWATFYSDGSWSESDWGTTRNFVMEEVGWKKLHVNGKLEEWPRFKRLK